MRRAVNVTRAERGTITIISCGLRSSSPSVPTTRVGAEDESGLEAVISRSYVQVGVDTKPSGLPILGWEVSEAWLKRGHFAGRSTFRPSKTRTYGEFDDSPAPHADE